VGQLPDLVRWAARHHVEFVIVTHMLPYSAETAKDSAFETSNAGARAAFADWKARAAAEGVDIGRYYDVFMTFHRTPEEARVMEWTRRMVEDAATRGITLNLQRLFSSDESLRPRVEVAGYAGDAVVDETFAPELKFVFDPVSLRLDTAGDPQTALTPREQGSAVEQREARIGVGPLSLPVTDARVFSALGVGIALLALLGAFVLLSRRLAGTEAERIEARHGSRIVPATTVIPEGRWVTDVPDIDSLVRLADHYDRVVLRTTDGMRHTYLVDDGVAVYRYRADAGATPASSMSPLHGRS